MHENLGKYGPNQVIIPLRLFVRSCAGMGKTHTHLECRVRRQSEIHYSDHHHPDLGVLNIWGDGKLPPRVFCYSSIDGLTH